MLRRYVPDGMSSSETVLLPMSPVQARRPLAVTPTMCEPAWRVGIALRISPEGMATMTTCCVDSDVTATRESPGRYTMPCGRVYWPRLMVRTTRLAGTSITVSVGDEPVP